MKKFLTAFAALCVASLLFAETEMVDGIEWTYTVSDGKARIGDRSAAIPTSTTGAITIPSTLGGYPVTSIGYSAFSGCTNLTSVTVPGCVTNIGEYAFYRCTNLTSVTILNGVSSIEEYAFYDCSGLKGMAIPDSVTRIGSVTFGNCRRLKSFSVTAGNQSYKDDSGLLLSKDGKTLVAGITDRVRIPDGVTSIGWAAFCGRSGLTSVSIPNSVTNIDGLAFDECNSLTSVTIPNSVASIGECAFSRCSGLTSMTIPESVTNIGKSAFHGCTNLTGVTIPDRVTNIGDAAFAHCSRLTSVTIPDSVISIGNSAFFGCRGLRQTVLPQRFNGRLHSSVFAKCPVKITYSAARRSLNLKAKTETVDGIEWTYTIYGGEARMGGRSAAIPISTTGAITIPSTLGGYPVTSIGFSAFKGCNRLASVTIPNGVTCIGDHAFLMCDKMTSVVIPPSVTNIGWSAFSGCRRLSSVTIPEGVKCIGRGAFSGCCGLTLVTIPASVICIEEMAFSGSPELYNREPNGWSVRRGNGPAGVSLMSFAVDSENPSYSSRNGLLCSKDGADLIVGVNGNVNIPKGVKNIGKYAFSGCQKLTSVMIPSSVTNIGFHAFENCSALTAVTIPSSVTSIESGAFFRTPFYDKLPDGMVVLGGGVLYAYKGECQASITIPPTVTRIKNYVFSDQCGILLLTLGRVRPGLKSVTIPSSVTSIGERAFFGCSELTSFSVAADNPVYKDASGLLLTKDGKTLVAVPGGLTSVTIPNSVSSIGNSAFCGCTNIMSVTMPNSVTNIGNSAFQGCRALTSVTIPNGVTSIGEYAFLGCVNLTGVTVPESVTSVGRDAFSGVQSPSLPKRFQDQLAAERMKLRRRLPRVEGTLRKVRETR